MRHLGIVLLFAGLVLVAIGWFVGFGSLFAWNGRHPIAVLPLSADTPAHLAFAADAKRRYTASVQIVFDRQGLVEKDGALVVEAKFPIVMTFKDDAGTVVAKLTDWVDPAVPPSVLYGQAHGAEAQHAPGAPPPELFVERLLGPWPSATRQTLSLDVNLGSDRVGKARVLEARAVIYDDAYPTPVRVGLGAFAVGVLASLAGLAALVLRGIARWLSRRSGIRAHKRA